MHTSPVLLWTIEHTVFHEYFPDKYQLVWLGADRVLIGTVEDGWHLLDVAMETILFVWLSGDVPKRITRGEPLGETEIIPDENAVDMINSFLASGNVEEREDVAPISVVSQEVEPTPPQSLFIGGDPLSQAVTTWALKSRLAIGSKITPRAWTILLNDEEVGVFISNQKPFVVFNEIDQTIYIIVQRWDNGLDIFHVCQDVKCEHDSE